VRPELSWALTPVSVKRTVKTSDEMMRFMISTLFLTGEL
jgi:hypothetical protein